MLRAMPAEAKTLVRLDRSKVITQTKIPSPPGWGLGIWMMTILHTKVSVMQPQRGDQVPPRDVVPMEEENLHTYCYNSFKVK
jgi:hypothetical protein